MKAVTIVTDRAAAGVKPFRGWAHEPYADLEGTARDAWLGTMALQACYEERRSESLVSWADRRAVKPFAEALIRAFQWGPIPLRRLRLLCGCERSGGHRLRIRGVGHVFCIQRSAKMHRASTHLPTEHCVLRLSNLPFRHELGRAVRHSFDPAFSFSEVVAATSDTDMRGVMDVPGMCGHNKSVGCCSHCGCT